MMKASLGLTLALTKWAAGTSISAIRICNQKSSSLLAIDLLGLTAVAYYEFLN